MLPMLVAVRGRVTSPEPAKCELSDTPAVLRQLVEEELYFKESSGGKVSREAFEVRVEQEQREAFLEDMSGSIKLDSLHRAAGLKDVLESKMAFTRAEIKQGPNLLEALVNRAFSGMVQHGTRVREQYLPVNATVTVLGQLEHDRMGSLPDSRTAQASSSASGRPHGPSHGGDEAQPAAADAAAERSASGAGAGSSGRAGGVSSALAGAAAVVGSELLGQAAAAVGSAAVRALPYVLRMPPKGPFTVTYMTLPQLRSSMESTTKLLRAFGWGFGVLGAALMVRRVGVQLWRAREYRRYRRIMEEAEAVRRQRQAVRAKEPGCEAAGEQAADAGGDAAGAAGGAGRDEEESGGRAANTCVVCMDRDTEVVFTPCGHMCACFACSHGLGRCPICRETRERIRVFRP